MRARLHAHIHLRLPSMVGHDLLFFMPPLSNLPLPRPPLTTLSAPCVASRMDLEKQRGISITSTALTFDYSVGEPGLGG